MVYYKINVLYNDLKMISSFKEEKFIYRIVGTIYSAPGITNFIEILIEHFAKINTSHSEIYVLGNFDINLFSKNLCF